MAVVLKLVALSDFYIEMCVSLTVDSSKEIKDGLDILETHSKTAGRVIFAKSRRDGLVIKFDIF